VRTLATIKSKNTVARGLKHLRMINLLVSF